MHTPASPRPPREQFTHMVRICRGNSLFPFAAGKQAGRTGGSERAREGGSKEAPDQRRPIPSPEGLVHTPQVFTASEGPADLGSLRWAESRAASSASAACKRPSTLQRPRGGGCELIGAPRASFQATLCASAPPEAREGGSGSVSASLSAALREGEAASGRGRESPSLRLSVKIEAFR